VNGTREGEGNKWSCWNCLWGQLVCLFGWMLIAFLGNSSLLKYVKFESIKERPCLINTLPLPRSPGPLIINVFTNPTFFILFLDPTFKIETLHRTQKVSIAPITFGQMSFAANLVQDTRAHAVTIQRTVV